MEYILCVGDSLTFGARDEFHSSYPAELSRQFWEKDNKKVYCINYGINGETSGQLLSRIYSNSRSCPKAKIALLLIGTNDTFLPQSKDVYVDNLRQICAVLKDNDLHVGIGLLPPVLGPGLLTYPSDAQNQVDEFNKIILNKFKEFGCFLADFRGMGKYIIDTVHFNHIGYVKMAEIWYDSIKKENLLC